MIGKAPCGTSGVAVVGEVHPDVIIPGAFAAFSCRPGRYDPKFGLTLVKTDIYLTGELLSNSNLFFPAQFAIEKTKQSLSKPELNG